MTAPFAGIHAAANAEAVARAEHARAAADRAAMFLLELDRASTDAEVDRRADLSRRSLDDVA